MASPNVPDSPAIVQPGFQAGCSCTKADYAATHDATTIEVVNACSRADGSTGRVEGFATVVDADEPAKLRVSFGGLGDVFSRLLGPSNYWVVAREADYLWAVVSTRFRRPVWILAREPRLADATLKFIKEGLSREGFDARALKDTRQEGCTSP
jgi:apolipoprotein D and lipocalin family protein